MFTGKLILTNPNRVPLALSNDFDNTFLLQDEIEDCQSIEEARKILNKYSIYKNWTVDKEKVNHIRFKSVDSLGNIHYLLMYKEGV